MNQSAHRVPLLAVVLLTPACAPMIPHGPDVRPGFTGGITASIGRGPTYENGDDPGPFYWGAAMLNAAYGFRSSRPSLPSLRIAAQGPTLGGVSSDIYLQAPRGWLGKVAAGFGYLDDLSARRKMPYAQMGFQNARGWGLHFVEGHYSDRGRTASHTYEESAWVSWLSLQLAASRWATVHLHGGFARGHEKKTYLNSITPYIDEDRWVVLPGATIEIHGRNP